jgi:arylformamidase
MSPFGLPDRDPAIDPQFTLDSIPDIASVRARRTQAAAEGLAQFPARRRIAYGPGHNETLILFAPPPAGPPAPLQIFIHGGFWSAMEAADFGFLAPGFVPFGSALALIDYPLIPHVRMADIIAACRRAIAFLHRQAGAYGIDPDRIFISGNSAGGHLVGELMDRSWTQAAGLPLDVIKGGTAISGLFDLVPVAASFQNDALGFTAEEISMFSPLRHPAAIAAPMIITVGGDETAEFLAQSARFAEHVRAGGAAVDHLVVPGTNHITIVLDEFAVPGTALNQAVLRQMGLSGRQ